MNGGWTLAMGNKTDNHRNHLANEKSPYLLQHANNPVDWYPWGEEAFQKAQRENKPVFLSIGYSTCHWCHVMERESFEDEGVAALMNEAFVSIKVDREERPDLDNIYMTACRLMTGGGGWPLTIIMTPGKKPFFAGTYIPKENRYGYVGMKELIPRVREVWETQKEQILGSADEVVKALQTSSAFVAGEKMDESILEAAYDQFRGSFDSVNGGFGAAPKFPTPHNLMFLLRYWKRTGESHALEMVEKTLQEMREGGIYDHVGYGFHRYSTDARWLLPHFEKMLYDQALLIMAYTEAYLATGKREYEEAARETVEYIMRDLTDPGGGFYSAEDADSEGEEGKFYVWTEEQIRDNLSDEEADMVIEIYNIEPGGNFEKQSTGGKSDQNILHMRNSWSEAASRLNMDEDDLRTKARESVNRLFKIRKERIHPYKDDKILTDWNGLMIAALAKAASAFGDSDYARAGSRAADFILGNLRTVDGRLLHRFRDGQPGLDGNLDDYAFLVFGLLELYESTFEIEYLEEALKLNDVMIDHFLDREHGGFYFTPDDGEKLLVRQKEIYDGATPSGNSVAAYNLSRLGRITGRTEYEDISSKIAGLFSSEVNRAPSGYTFLLMAVDFMLGLSHEIVIVGTKDSEDTILMMEALNKSFLPGKVVVFKPKDGSAKRIEDLVSFTAGLSAKAGKATAFVCRNYTCEIPMTDVGEMMRQLKRGIR
jgi:uncharacterized protein YyaL (SSP411 family)